MRKRLMYCQSGLQNPNFFIYCCKQLTQSQHKNSLLIVVNNLFTLCTLCNPKNNLILIYVFKVFWLNTL